jgi:hypothetical protein
VDAEHSVRKFVEDVVVTDRPAAANVSAGQAPPRLLTVP